ncbi:MAG: ABC transporter ATP-binding protein/permease, partial [Roseburia sp.]|nr:ABC transporter ATP-binding protein/permease [Roseburia sp.]
CARTVLSFWKKKKVFENRNESMIAVSESLAGHLLKCKEQVFSIYTPTYLVARIVDEIFQLEGILVYKLMDGIISAAICLFYFIWLFHCNVFVGTMTVVLLVADYVFALKLPLIKVYREHNEELARLKDETANLLDGVIQVKVSDSYEKERKRFRESWKRYTGKLMKRDMMRQLQLMSGDTCKQFGNVLMILVCAGLLSCQKIDLANFVLMLNLYQYIWGMSSVVESLIPQYKQGITACERIAEILDLEEETIWNETSEEWERLEIESIGLEHVSFSYQDKKILQDCTLLAKKGELTSLVGQSGCGKSTILSLLLGLEEPDSGAITLNGKKVTPEMLRQIRKKIGYVNQETFLFHRTIRENLTYHVEQKIKDETLWELLQEFDLKERICSMKDGLDTVLTGEKEILSGGEKERIGIIRELLRTPQILLLDECTAHVDAENEARIYQKLNQLKPKMILIQAAHKETALSQSDRVYRF